jgi:F-type H+-transporting ATPase subunit b
MLAHKMTKLAFALGLALVAAPAVVHAQPAAPGDDRKAAEAARAEQAAPGDSESARGPGTEHHTEGGSEVDEEEPDPTRHFNFFGFQPGHVFDYMGKDEYGGKFGDGQMLDPHSGRVLHEEEPASPPFIFMLINFALLLGILAWKGRPVAHEIAAERHDQIKSALDEAAKLRKQAQDKLAEYESRLKDADAQITQMVEGMRADAENEKQRILAAAATTAAQMKRDAEQRIAAEIELARATLTREVTAAAAAATERMLREKMTTGDQQNLVSAFITDVQSASRSTKGEAR